MNKNFKKHAKSNFSKRSCNIYKGLLFNLGNLWHFKSTASTGINSLMQMGHNKSMQSMLKSEPILSHSISSEWKKQWLFERIQKNLPRLHKSHAFWRNFFVKWQPIIHGCWREFSFRTTQKNGTLEYYECFVNTKKKANKLSSTFLGGFKITLLCLTFLSVSNHWTS
jgi:hypothetical protein